MSRLALCLLVLLQAMAVWVALPPSGEGRQLALVFRPGTSDRAMLETAIRLGHTPIVQPGGWPVLLARAGASGAGLGAGPLLLALPVATASGCSGGVST